MWETQVIHIR